MAGRARRRLDCTNRPPWVGHSGMRREDWRTRSRRRQSTRVLRRRRRPRFLGRDPRGDPGGPPAPPRHRARRVGYRRRSRLGGRDYAAAGGASAKTRRSVGSRRPDPGRSYRIVLAVLLGDDFGRSARARRLCGSEYDPRSLGAAAQGRGSVRASGRLGSDLGCRLSGREAGDTRCARAAARREPNLGGRSAGGTARDDRERIAGCRLRRNQLERSPALSADPRQPAVFGSPRKRLDVELGRVIQRAPRRPRPGCRAYPAQDRDCRGSGDDFAAAGERNRPASSAFGNGDGLVDGGRASPRSRKPASGRSAAGFTRRRNKCSIYCGAAGHSDLDRTKRR